MGLKHLVVPQQTAEMWGSMRLLIRMCRAIRWILRLFIFIKFTFFCFLLYLDHWFLFFYYYYFLFSLCNLHLFIPFTSTSSPLLSSLCHSLANTTTFYWQHGPKWLNAARVLFVILQHSTAVAKSAKRWFISYFQRNKRGLNLRNDWMNECTHTVYYRGNNNPFYYSSRTVLYAFPCP